MAQVSKEFLIQCLRSGFTISQIAESLNVTPSAVQQVVDAHDLRTQAADSSKFQSIDNKLNTIEEKVLTQLDRTVGTIVDPMKLARVLQVVNGAKRRSLSEGAHKVQEGARLVQLNLPEHLEVSVVLNAKRQVESIDGRLFETMPSGEVLDKIKSTSSLAQELEVIEHDEDSETFDAPAPKKIGHLL